MIRQSVNHRLKIKPHWFDRLVEGSKTCEVRKDDRDYQIGDTITVGKCCRPSHHGCSDYGICLISSTMTFQITHVLRGGQYGIESGWCVLSLTAIDALKDKP